jgi:hypothetical protein
MAGLLSRERLLCPACGYDVEQTVRDRIGVCPECGAAVSADICRVESRVIPESWWWPVTLASFAPTIAVVAAIVLGMMTDVGWPLGGLLPFSLSAMAIAWWKVERRLEPEASFLLTSARVAGWVMTLLMPNLGLCTALFCLVSSVLN